MRLYDQQKAEKQLREVERNLRIAVVCLVLAVAITTVNVARILGVF